MPRLFSGLIAGLLFGLGLAISQMISQQKVLSFLDIFGKWDPTLLFVMGGAVAVTALLSRVVLRRPRPLFERKFYLPDSSAIDRPLVVGSALFGIGWGLGGFCPGPGFASLALGRIEPWVFVATLVIGSQACKWLSSKPSAQHAGARDDQSAL
ncbi:MAG: YeeE/YedE family protein [Betaproteobacteria bacterium]